MCFWNKFADLSMTQNWNSCYVQIERRIFNFDRNYNRYVGLTGKDPVMSSIGLPSGAQ